MVAPPGVRSIAMIRACLLSTRPGCWDDVRGRRPTADWVGGLAFAALRAVWFAIVFLLLECDEVLRFDFALDIGISFRFSGVLCRHHRCPTSATKPAGQDP